jgi:hypothetical protein
LPNHPYIGKTMNNLASVLLSLNRLIESEVLYRETLNFKKINLMPNDPDIGITMDGLAEVLHCLNRLK